MRNFFFCFFCVITFCCAFTNCSKVSADSNYPKISYGEDANYFLALHSIAEGKTDEAIKQLTRAAKKGSHYVSRRSMEQLTKIGNIQMRVTASETLVKNFPDEESFLRAAQEYTTANEFSKIILMTDNIDLSTCPNELARLRVTALNKKSDSRFSESVYKWFTSRPFSAQHEIFFSENNWQETDYETENYVSPVELNQRKIISFRREVYQRNYHSAYEKSSSLLQEIEDASMQLPYYIVSDMGKAFLYSNNYLPENIKTFTAIASNAEYESNNLLAFYARFYAARLSERAGNFKTAKQQYEQAMAAAAFVKDDDRYDNALWYLLNCILANSLDEVLPAVRTYCTQWNDASYFDDFFYSLAPQLLSASRWQDFKNIATATEGYVSNKVTSQYSFIYAKALSSNLINSSTSAEQEAAQFFEKSINTGYDNYYAILSAKELGLSDDQLLKIICEPQKPATANTTAKETVENAERFMRGYATFGLPELIYDEWKNFYDKKIYFSLETNELLAGFLQQCGNTEIKYYPQSLRIATFTKRNSTENLSGNLLRLSFPKDFEPLVNDACNMYDLPEELLFGLIHSESFFDASAKSSAGAIGLTQLMEFTAADIAQRLKQYEYDATKPEDSIKFGAYYLSNLKDRLYNSPLAALLAYNAGITRVRRWINSSRIDINPTRSGNYELFLESVPFEETRNYGRNVISAAVMYGMLYYGKSYVDIIDELM